MKEQIDELAMDIYSIFRSETVSRAMASMLIEKGWSKHGKWISVDERVPKKSTMVLCFYPEKDYGSKVVVDYAETDNGHFAEQFIYGDPSHWMPIPEPTSNIEVKDYPPYLDRPKKGGAE